MAASAFRPDLSGGRTFVPVTRSGPPFARTAAIREHEAMGLTHITRRVDFRAAADSGRRYRFSAATVQIREREAAAGEGLRLGLTASRQTGTAVERNRIRRRLRAAAERAFAEAAGRPLDVVVVARREVLGESFDRLAAELGRALTESRPHKRRSGAPLPAGQSGRAKR